MVTKEESTKIKNFMTPRAGFLVLGRHHIVNTISSPLLVYTRVWLRQIKYKAIMIKEGYAKIVNFITIGAGSFMLGRSVALHLNKLASPSPRDTLWQVWLKYAQ